MKKLLSIILVICMLISVISITASAETEYTKPYEEEFLKILEPYFVNNVKDYIYTGPIYEYYSEDNTTDTPDWVLVFGTTTWMEEWPFFGVLGDYYFRDYSCWVPTAIPYYVYVLEEGEFYHISEAIRNNLEGIDTAFTEHLLKYDDIGVLGDFDGDDKLTILDATGIQRALAGKCDFPLNDLWPMGDYSESTTDFDRDGERTVMDATAIQMKLAKK